MYHLSSSLQDRASFDESARALARERMRGAEVPISEIDPYDFALQVMALEGLAPSDDLEEAKARFIDAFLFVHKELSKEEEEE